MAEMIYTTSAGKKSSSKRKGKTVKRVNAPKSVQMYCAKIFAKSNRNLYGGREIAQTDSVKSFSDVIASINAITKADQNKYAVVYRSGRVIGYIYRGNCYYPDNSYAFDCYIWKYAGDAEKGRDRVYELRKFGDKWDFHDFHRPGMEFDEGYEE